MESNYKKLGGYIRQIDLRNSDGSLGEENLYGISVTKEFIISHANLVGVTFYSYKVVLPRQFAYIPDTSRRGDKIAISLNTFGEDIIVSSICSVFEIVDEDQLLPEYLMMWFMRPEFDRYARFMSNGSAREVFDWDCMCGVELPVPPISEQREIVHDYQVITDRIELLRKMNEKLEDLLECVYKELFIENSNVNNYKMIAEIADTIDNRGKTPPNDSVVTNYPLIEIASLRTKGRIPSYEKCTKYINKETYEQWFRNGHPQKKDILMSTVGSLAELKLFWRNKGSIAQNIVAFRCHDKMLAMYLYQYLLDKRKELMSYEIGSVQASIKVSQVVNYKITIPPKELLVRFDTIATIITEQIYEYERDIDLSNNLLKQLLHGLLKNGV